MDEADQVEDGRRISSEALGALTGSIFPFKAAGRSAPVTCGSAFGTSRSCRRYAAALRRSIATFWACGWRSVGPQPERDVKSRFNIAFLHCNRASLARVLAGADAKRLHHFMLQLESLDDVGATLRSLPAARSAARAHARLPYQRPDVSSSADALRLQRRVRMGARTVDDRDWQVQLHRTGSISGHRRAGA